MGSARPRLWPQVPRTSTPTLRAFGPASGLVVARTRLLLHGVVDNRYKWNSNMIILYKRKVARVASLLCPRGICTVRTRSSSGRVSRRACSQIPRPGKPLVDWVSTSVMKDGELTYGAVLAIVKVRSPPSAVAGQLGARSRTPEPRRVCQGGCPAWAESNDP